MNTNLNFKSEFCRFGEKCNKKDMCTYAHRLCELKPLECTRENCIIEKCIRIHKNESNKNFCERRKIKYPERKNEKMKICKTMKEDLPCAVENCAFCHSINEIVPVKCFTCKEGINPKCTYYHENQDIVDYYEKFDTSIKIKEFMYNDASQNTKKVKNTDDFLEILRNEQISEDMNRLGNDLEEMLVGLSISPKNEKMDISPKNNISIVINFEESDDDSEDECDMILSSINIDYENYKNTMPEIEDDCPSIFPK